MRHYGDRVVGVVDHHEDAGLYLDARERVIESVGSCATLVAEQMLDKGVEIEPGLANILLGTVLLDTINLDTSKKRSSVKDQDIVDRLAEIAGISRYEGTTLYQAITKVPIGK